MEVIEGDRTSSTQGKRRELWMDIIRGLGVLLVIFLHAQVKTDLAPGLTSGPAMDAIGEINRILSPFRMELMFFLSGMVVMRGLRKGTTTFLLGKLKHVLYPFIVWSLIIFSLKQLKAVLSGKGVDWSYLVTLPLGSLDLTWFLHHLFLFYLLIVLLRQLHSGLVIGTCLLLATVIPHEIHEGLPGLGYNILNNFFYYFIFFYAGDWLSENGALLLRALRPHWLALSSLAFIGAFCIAWYVRPSATWPGYAVFVLGSFPLLIFFAKLLEKSGWFAPVAYAGRNSIVFYLAHFPVQGVMVMLFSRLFDSALVVFLLLLASGIVASLILAKLRDRVPFFGLLFSPPDGRQKASSPPQATAA